MWDIFVDQRTCDWPVNFMQYIKQLKILFNLCTLLKKKPVSNCDDLYYWLYTHWVIDDSIFLNEHQQVQHSTEMLMGSFFNYKLCSLFNIKVKFKFFNINKLGLNAFEMTEDHNILKAVKFHYKTDNTFKMIHNNSDEGYNNLITTYNSVNNNNSDTAYDDDCDNINDSDSFDINDDCSTDNKCTAESKEI